MISKKIYTPQERDTLSVDAADFMAGKLVRRGLNVTVDPLSQFKKEYDFRPYLESPAEGVKYAVLDDIRRRQYQSISRVMSSDATWRDTFMLRYTAAYDYIENQCGGFDNVKSRISELLSTVSVSERQAEGYFFNDEITPENAGKVKVVKGDLKIEGKMDFPVLQHVNGSLSVSKKSSLNAPVLKCVESILDVPTKARFNAPSLNSVGSLKIDKKTASIKFPSLEHVDFLGISRSDNCFLPALKSVGDLGISARYFEAPSLRYIKGNIEVYSDCHINVPNLYSIKDLANFHDGSVINAPSLAIATGLWIRDNVSLDLPSLMFVDDDFEIECDSHVSAPNLRKVKELTIGADSTLNAPVLDVVSNRMDLLSGCSINAPSLKSVGKLLLDSDVKRVNCPGIGIEQHRLELSDGKSYGYDINGRIHLMPKGIDPETPIHEYSHLWLEAYRKNYPEKWSTLCDIVEQQGLDRCVREDAAYSYLKSDRDAVVEETLCRIVGSKGADTLFNLSFEPESSLQVVERFRKLVNDYAVSGVYRKEIPSDIKEICVGDIRSFADNRSSLSIEMPKVLNDSQATKKSKLAQKKL